MKACILVTYLAAASLLASCGQATPAAPAAARTATALTSPVEFESNITGDPNHLKIPLGVAADAQGNLYVVDVGNSRIQVFDSSGKFLRMWGSKGTGDGQFDFGGALGGDSVVVDHQGDVYVGDYSHRVQKFDSQGNFLKAWLTTGHGEGKPKLANAPELYLALDPQDNVYVADYQYDRVEKFDADGNFLLQWGGTDAGDAELYGPSVATDASGNVYVAEYLNGRVQKFDGNGKVLGKFFMPLVNGQAVSPATLAVDSRGNLYIVDTAASRIVVVDTSGAAIAAWGESGSGDGQLMGPASLALDGQGNIYVGDRENDRVVKFKLKTN